MCTGMRALVAWFGHNLDAFNGGGVYGETAAEVIAHEFGHLSKALDYAAAYARGQEGVVSSDRLKALIDASNPDACAVERQVHKELYGDLLSFAPCRD
jgi:hypothetical protein